VMIVIIIIIIIIIIKIITIIITIITISVKGNPAYRICMILQDSWATCRISASTSSNEPNEAVKFKKKILQWQRP
jgi:hypothetical protein